ncbi:MAG: aminotransferase class III-fold pyridoxal phosphate-dependent enzyme [Gammaproteobacteria bacterium]|nr:aminotransferase class III-fold pyridoxal phosphate-dependent enzyme [Gammaproteobacteria bacterium]
MPIPDDAKLIERRRRLLGPAYRLFYNNPVHLVRGEGVWLYDADGNKYLDMYNNVPHVGHCHPRVVEALTHQIGTLNTHTRYLHENVLNYAERLTALMPDELSVAMFSCTGSEANELALRIARSCSDGTGIIVVDNAYHGNTYALAQVSTSYASAEDKPANVETVPPPDTFRGQYRDVDATERYVTHIEIAIEKLRTNGIKPAAFMIDTIDSSNGVLDVPNGYLKRAAEVIRGAGGLFIADEVQPGFGRTGRNFWGFEADDFVPDIVTMGKPMGNGHPLAATVTRTDLIERFAEKTRYFNTFGGNPVSAAAGNAVLDVIENEGLQANAFDVGRHLRDGLLGLADRYKTIADVRGSGLFLGVDLATDRDTRAPASALATAIVNDLRERGVLTNTIGAHANILKLRPPMVLSKADADYFLDIFEQSIAAMTASVC